MIISYLEIIWIQNEVLMSMNATHLHKKLLEIRASGEAVQEVTMYNVRVEKTKKKDKYF